MLRLSKRNAVHRIEKLGKEIFQDDGISCNYFSKPRRYDAATSITDDGYANEVSIGLVNVKNVPFGRSVSDENFTRVILNMYHEKMHCIQKNEMFRQTNSEYENQLVQEIACNASNEYYENNGNYLLNANEIQAEQYGIMGAYNYLRDEFPEMDAKEHERIVLGIVNSKMMDPKADYFVKQSEPFKSLQEVETAFDVAYDKSFTEKRTFLMEREPKDPVKIFMNDHEDAKEMYFKAPTAVEQDRCIAAIALKLHPEWLNVFPALKDMDLSYENVIAKPYREIKEREERALHAKEEEMDGIVKGKVNVEPVKVPEKKAPDKKDLQGLSRGAMADELFGHLMKDEKSVKNAESEYEE